ncbi:MAG: SprT family zinc-dependent metalloprotease [Bacteroidales bacterium]
MQTGRDFKYRIIFSHRRTLGITVSPDKGVIARAPYRTPAKTIDRFIREKSEWIINAIDGFNALVRIDNTKGYSNGDPVLLFGKKHTLIVVPSDSYAVRLNTDYTIEIQSAMPDNPLVIKALVERWVNVVAKKRLTLLFGSILTEYKKYGFTPTGFGVRTMKKRWGSCSASGRIGISYDLIRLDEIYARYVIMHELCHLKHHNHGAGFYQHLGEVFPLWKDVREGLKKYLR